MMKKAFLSYLICVHFVLLIVLVKSDFINKVLMKLDIQQSEISRHYQIMTSFHQRIDKNTASESIIFIGDSHIQGLAVSAVAANAVNYGIGGDTSFGVMARLRVYKSLSSSKAVILAIGFNDFKYRSNAAIIDNVEQILTQLPNRTAVILCAISPVGKIKHAQYNQRISELNNSFKSLSLGFSNVSFLDAFHDAREVEGYLLPSRWSSFITARLSPLDIIP